jgi:hypothetical protein
MLQFCRIINCLPHHWCTTSSPLVICRIIAFPKHNQDDFHLYKRKYCVDIRKEQLCLVTDDEQYIYSLPFRSAATKMFSCLFHRETQFGAFIYLLQSRLSWSRRRTSFHPLPGACIHRPFSVPPSLAVLVKTRIRTAALTTLS